jgi:hypothetical protein
MAARRHRRRLRPLVWCSAVALGLALPGSAVPEATLSSAPAAARAWWSAARRPPAARPEAEPAPAARRLTQAGFDGAWSGVKAAMAACDRAASASELRWRASGEPPRAEDLETARDLCGAAIVEVGATPLPDVDRPGVRMLLEQARDACQRSMAERQLGLAAIRTLAEAPPDSLAAYEARLRIAAGPRSGLNCAASFGAAARAARLQFAELELTAGDGS